MEKDTNTLRSSSLSLSNYNSTTVLAEDGKYGKDAEYNPFEHRDMRYANTTMGALAHLLKSSLGSGILAMPMAFRNAGLLFGGLGTIIIGILCTHCVHIFVATSQGVCRKAKIPSLGFAETTEKVFENGPLVSRRYASLAKSICEYGLTLTYMMGNTMYIVLIASSFQMVVNFKLNVEWDLRYYIAVVVLPCLLLGQIRKLKYLVPFSVIANISIIVTFAITLWYILTGPIDIMERPLFAPWTRLPMFFSTVIFAMEGIGTVMPIENSMLRPQYFLGCPGVLNTAMITVVGLYGFMGFLGYLRYGEAAAGSITLNLPKDTIPAQVAQIAIAIAIQFTFGLQYFVPMDILWRKFSPKISKEKHNIAQIALRAVCVLIMGTVGVLVPKLDPFISLVGAVFFSFLGLFIPALVETMFRYPDDLGFCKFILIKNLILMIFAMLALAMGAHISIKQIIALYA